MKWHVEFPFCNSCRSVDENAVHLMRVDGM